MAEKGNGRLRLVFMGTPDFAAVIMRHALGWDGGEIVAAYTQPDRPCGRGKSCKPSAVKVLAMEHGIPVMQPEHFKRDADVDALRALAPDAILVAAYGLILPRSVLDIPRYGCINVHGSLLPRYRGAAPIQRAIMNGEQVTGITIMQMEAGLDTGPMLLQRALGIGIDDTSETLHDQLADMGGRMLVEALDRLPDGRLLAMPQDDALSSYAAKLTKAEGEVRFDRPAIRVHNHIRGVHPWPGAFYFFDTGTGEPLRLTLEPGRIGPDLTEEQKALPAGTLVGEQDGYLAFTCTDKLYEIPCVRPEGRKAMDGRSFVCGYLHRC
ncbi:MAG: methionyl-tRNA formyltransferase [Desulfovibrionaceae bacterium]